MAEKKQPGDPAELVNLQTLGVSLVKRGANRKKFALAKAEDVTEKIVAAIKVLVEKGDLPDEEKLAALCLGLGLDEKEVEAVKAMMRIRSAFPRMDKLDAAMKAAIGGPEAAMPPTEGEPKQPGAEGEGKPPFGGEKKEVEGQVEGKAPAPGTEIEAEPKGGPPQKTEAAPVAAAGEQEPQKKEPYMADEKDKKVVKSETEQRLEAVMKGFEDKLAAQEKLIGELTVLHKAADDRAVATEAALKAEQARRREGEWLAKAEKDLRGVPGKTEDIVKTLIEIEDKVGAEAAQKQFAMLKASSDVVLKSPAFVPTRKVEGQEGDALQRIEKSADAFLQKALEEVASDPSLKYMTHEMRTAVAKSRAQTRALEASKGVYSNYVEETAQ